MTASEFKRLAGAVLRSKGYGYDALNTNLRYVDKVVDIVGTSNLKQLDVTHRWVTNGDIHGSAEIFSSRGRKIKFFLTTQRVIDHLEKLAVLERLADL